MVAAINPQPAPPTSATDIDKNPNPARPPLLPSQKQHNAGGNAAGARKPRGKQVPSRYLSPSPSASNSSTSTSTSTATTATTTTTSSSSSSSSSSTFPRRFASPLLSRTAKLNTAGTISPFTAPKRSQSVDRKRPAAARPITPNLESKQGNAPAEMSVASKMLITSTRSLSVSFQGEAFSLPISKAKAVTPPPQQPLSSGRKSTPERRRATPVRDQVENSRPSDQLRWPARSRDGNLSSKDRNHHSLLSSKSMDYSGGRDNRRPVGSGLMGAKSLQQSMMFDDTRRRLSLDFGSAKLNPDANLEKDSCFAGDLTESDSDSVSSGSTSGMQEFGGGGISKGKVGPRGIVVSSRFWQETNSRLRRLQDPGSPLSTSPGSRMGFPSKVSQSKRFSTDGPLNSPRSMTASPIRGASRPASPGKLWSSSASSPMRGMSSPSRARPMSGSPMNTPSILSFSVDLRRGKIGEDRINDAHTLRLLYNRYLQWRFVNARADTTFTVQKLNAEKNMWNAWLTISELRHSVTLKRVKMLLLKQKLKLTSIMKGQINFLEDWSVLERDHCTALDGANEALKASTLRLPIVGNAITDVQNLKDAVGSAVDIMQAMASSICSQLSRVDEMNSLVAELVNVIAKEKVFLDQCRDFSSTLAALQVKDCSLRTHILQLNRLPAAT
ncbi:QWRF motif-containing protein 2 [Linum perenne]